MISLKDYQSTAISQLKTGSILNGGVGSGKSITLLAYYFTVECKGTIKTNDQSEWGILTNPKDLYIITTARKRDSLEWEKECARFMLSKEREDSVSGVKVTIDSWNNISKYKRVTDAFFIFDEQRLVGSGSWVKSFLKISKSNNWILLSATPGDTWLDYIPVFIANGFYKNRTDFLMRHVVYNTFTKYPKIDRYIETRELNRLKQLITVNMLYEKKTINHTIIKTVEFDSELLSVVEKKRWNPFKNLPIKDASELGYTMRRAVNIHSSRLKFIEETNQKHQKLIVFYNFNYELEILRSLKDNSEISVAEYNGHKHEVIPSTNRWIYLVQYTSGAEAWNCIETNAILFYSLNYSYRTMTQSAGRIDRMNTSFLNLYYYYLISNSPIDQAIDKALKEKKDFNELDFLASREKHML